jgi:hypothetical protein
MRILLFVVFSFVFSPALMAEDKPDPRATVESALDHCIALMEKKEHVKLIKECYSPTELEKQLRGMTVEELVKHASMNPEFEAQSKEQIEVWKECKTKTPEYNDDKTEAKYLIKKPDGTERLTFVKEGNLWYISLSKSVSKKVSPAKSPE